MVSHRTLLRWPQFTMVRSLIILYLCAWIAPTALGGEWLDIGRRAPADIELMVVVRDGASLRANESSRPFAELLTTIVRPTETVRAWDALAREIDLPPNLAFDELLGNRVVVFMRRGEDGDPEWALESEVDADTARRLLLRLKVKPQDIKANKVIALIENGQFQMTSYRRGDQATLLFAPTASGQLFDQLLKRMSRHSHESLANEAAFEMAASTATKTTSAFLFFRPHDKDGAWESLAAHINDDVVHAEFASSADESLLPETPFREEQWDRIAKGSVLAIVEPLASLDLPLSFIRDYLIGDDLKIIPFPVEGRMAVTVEELPEGGLAVAVGAETPDVDRLAPIGDAFIAGLAQTLEMAERDDADAESFATLQGLFPEAARTIVLSAKNKQGRTQHNPISTGELALTWSYPAVSACDDRCGWWVVATDRTAHDRIARTLTLPTKFDLKNSEPVSYLHAEPARLVRALRTAGLLHVGEDNRVVQALSLIESMQGYTVFVEGLLRGELELRLQPSCEDASD